MHITKRLLRELVENPSRTIKKKCLGIYFRSSMYHKLVLNNTKKAINLQWFAFTGEDGLNWNNPVDLNEKIEWLIANSDTSEWTRLADKSLVKDYVKSKGFGSSIIKTYGIWDKVEDIDYGSLPDSFVIKCTHDCESSHIIKSKQCDLNIEVVNKDLKKHLLIPNGSVSCEPHYLRIKPRIIAEELIQNDTESAKLSTSLIDYKFWCTNGKILTCFCCYDRGRTAKGPVHTFDNYSIDPWEPHREMLSEAYSHQNFKNIPKPLNYDKMLDMAKVLSEGFPEVRVDLYNVSGKIYFGEMTFTSCAGRMPYYTKEALTLWGSQVDLSIAKLK